MFVGGHFCKASLSIIDLFSYLCEANGAKQQ